jgi:peptidoglycan endopeptidase LytE
MLYSTGVTVSEFLEEPGAHEADPEKISRGGTVPMQTSAKRILWSVVWAALLVVFLGAQASAITLRPGAKGTAVRQLQINLQQKGYLAQKHKINSAYTSAVKKAVGIFQIANAIKPAVALGVADEMTQQMLVSEDAVVYAEYVERVADAQLKLGGAGAHVKKVQTRLRVLGYYTGKIDSKYRAFTLEAVKLFQTANRLPANGVACRETRAVLYSGNAITRAQHDAANFLTPLGVGAKGTQVNQLQEKLAAKGFYQGDPTGVFDARTRYAVRFFQEANGLKINGSANRTVRALANSDAAVAFDEYAKDLKLMLLSSKAKPGIRVAVLQRQLQELGYYKGVITGVYSKPVITAVRLFQTFNNLPAKDITGKANLATRQKLLDAGALSYGQVYGDDTLKYGQTGDAVKKLQTRLKELGYYTGDINGRYDKTVVAAVKRFQKLSGLTQTGVAYSNTLSLLSSAKAISYVNANIEKLIAVAESKLGVPYVSPAKAPKTFDCSTFTAYCLKQVGISVTSSVQAQGRTAYGKKITITNSKNYKELKRGDILYFWSPDRVKKPGHAGIYLGNNKFIHASSGAGKVTVSAFKTYNERTGGPWFLWAIRAWG